MNVRPKRDTSESSDDSDKEDEKVLAFLFRWQKFAKGFINSAASNEFWILLDYKI